MNISQLLPSCTGIRTHPCALTWRRVHAPHAPFSHMSEQLFYNRKKKGWGRDAVRCGGAVSLCGSRWAFTSRSKAATVWVPLHWLVGVGTQNRGIVTSCVSASVCVILRISIVMCVYARVACFECVMSLSCGLSGASRAPPLSFVTERERHILKELPAFILWSGAESY